MPSDRLITKVGVAASDSGIRDPIGKDRGFDTEASYLEAWKG